MVTANTPTYTSGLWSWPEESRIHWKEAPDAWQDIVRSWRTRERATQTGDYFDVPHVLFPDAGHQFLRREYYNVLLLEIVSFRNGRWNGAFAVQGQPGSGKSVYLLFLLHWLVTEDQPVTLVWNDEVYLFFGNAVYTPVTDSPHLSEATRRHLPRDTEQCTPMWTLFDTNASYDVVWELRNETLVWPVMTTSNFNLGSGRSPDGIRRITSWYGIEPWNRDELIAGFALQPQAHLVVCALQNSDSPSNPSAADVMITSALRKLDFVDPCWRRRPLDEKVHLLIDDAIHNYGHVPRDVYSSIFDPLVTQATRDAALASLTFEDAIGACPAAFIHKPTQNSFVLFQAFIHGGKGGSYCRPCDFKSAYIAEHPKIAQFLTALDAKQRVELFYAAWTGCNESTLATQLFKKPAMDLLTTPGIPRRFLHGWVSIRSTNVTTSPNSPPRPPSSVTRTSRASSVVLPCISFVPEGEARTSNTSAQPYTFVSNVQHSAASQRPGSNWEDPFDLHFVDVDREDFATTLMLVKIATTTTVDSAEHDTPALQSYLRELIQAARARGEECMQQARRESKWWHRREKSRRLERWATEVSMNVQFVLLHPERQPGDVRPLRPRWIWNLPAGWLQECEQLHVTVKMSHVPLPLHRLT